MSSKINTKNIVNKPNVIGGVRKRTTTSNTPPQTNSSLKT